MVTRTGNLLYLSGKGIAQKKQVAISSSFDLILHILFFAKSKIISKAEVGIDIALSSISFSLTNESQVPILYLYKN